jgi:UDP-N-acetylglucosamine--dolichyl-phosphate N-acetylglucosaminephosphotransferase
MVSYLLFASIVISFLACLIFMPKWIEKCRRIGLLWEDMNRFSRPKNVAASGGVVVIMAFLLGVLSYVAIRTFIFDINGVTAQIFALLSVVLIAALIGVVDDMLGWHHGGLSWKFRLFLAFFASIPLVVINTGHSIVNVPFLGEINLGLIYPLVLIPFGVAGATTVYNFLAGFNGLEAGLGAITLSFLSFIAYKTGSPWLAMIGLCMVASLIAFYFFNKVPAKVFPGNALTWGVGALIAGMCIIGNFEKIALFVFIPYLIEMVLKIRGKLKKQSFGIPQKDGSLEVPYDKFYGLTHMALFLLKKLKGKVYERDVVYFIFAFQILLCLIAMLIF